ncbi:hypothetical protein D0864_09144 [Hortaea werneckii]|uniref:Uncharacterized protein n=1 Tax=Hortaea werneckii TaxID=91943 RepID=A0A3M7ESC3_HORWE|nr:hypothetical protein D0864_09144 [Hortaea werneckii]
MAHSSASVNTEPSHEVEEETVCHRFPLPTKPSGIEVIDIQPKNILLGVLDDSAFARATKRIAVSHGLRVKANVTHKGCTTTM